MGVVIFKDFCHWRRAVCRRNWHWDEPSCGYEVCVVMYHQPSAPPGLGGLYMFQWNDDNCETKNNFICKYTAGTADAAVQFSCALAAAECRWLWFVFSTGGPLDSPPPPNSTKTSKMCSVWFLKIHTFDEYGQYASKMVWTSFPYRCLLFVGAAMGSKQRQAGQKHRLTDPLAYSDTPHVTSKCQHVSH